MNWLPIGVRHLGNLRRIRRDGTSEIPGLMEGWYIGNVQVGWHGPYRERPVDPTQTFSALMLWRGTPITIPQTA